MPVNEAGAPAIRAAFSALIDYAGLFPPAQLPVEQAAAEYAAAQSGPHAWMLGRFIVPASRIGQLELSAMPLSVIVDAGNDSRSWLGNVQKVLGDLVELRAASLAKVEALEIVLAPLATLRETYDAAIGQFAASLAQSGLRDIPAYVEVPRDARWLESLRTVMFALARHRLGAKIRCGGLTADAVPEPPEIAAFLHAAADESVAFKATAGLHHPIRHFNAGSGFTMHGFLNMLAAAALARAGAPAAELTEALASEDAAQFRFDADAFEWNGRRIDAADIAAMRRDGFVGYGSCSFSEPIEDLRQLGIL